MNSTVRALLDRLSTTQPGAGIDIAEIREEVHAAFAAATSESDREVLLKVHKALCDMIERQLQPVDREESRKTRDQDYCLLLVTEAKIGDSSPNLNPHRMAQITRREVAAGRMAWDHELHKLSSAGAATIPEDRPTMLSRLRGVVGRK
jgi:hypothetical protein